MANELQAAKAIRGGLRSVAHAIRRSSALYTAYMSLPEGTPVADVIARAEANAEWLRGKAEEDDGSDVWLGERPE